MGKDKGRWISCIVPEKFNTTAATGNRIKVAIIIQIDEVNNTIPSHVNPVKWVICRRRDKIGICGSAIIAKEIDNAIASPHKDIEVTIAIDISNDRNRI